MSLSITKMKFGFIFIIVGLVTILIALMSTKLLRSFLLPRSSANNYMANFPVTLSKDENQLFISNGPKSCRKTDPAMTQMTVFRNNKVILYEKNALIQVVISTMDKEGKPTICGGDFFHAVMWNSQKFSIAGRIQDFDNGTYLASFYPAWSGQATITIALVHQRKEIQWFKSVWLADNRPPLPFWQGFYNTDELKEETLCWIAEKKNLTSNECMYANNVSLRNVVLLCAKPPKNGLVCDNLYSYHGDIPLMGKLVLKMKNGTNLFIYRQAQVLGGGPIDYYIQESFSPSTGITLPVCGGPTKTNSDSRSMVADGYWAAGKWISLKCRSRKWNVNSMKQCLRNKSIYFFGGSTNRQWYKSLASTLMSKKVESSGIASNTYISVDNINISFQFHPLRIGRGLYLLKEPYEVEVMDSFASSTCNYILVFAYWAHFPTWTLSTYRERLVQIKVSIERLLERCPNTAVVIKGSHPRDHKTEGSQVHSSDWVFYNMNTILKEVFDNVGVFLNIWDINLAYFGRNFEKVTIHMPEQVIKEEIQLFLSHICPHS